MKKEWQNIKDFDWMRTLIWTAILGMIAVAFAYAVTEQMNSRIAKLEIDIPTQKNERSLITKKGVSKKILDIVGQDIRTVDLIDLDLTRLEAMLEKDSRIENVEVYIDKRNTLKVSVEIRRPFIRIIADNGEQFYLDAKGSRIATVKDQAVRVPIVTGDVNKYSANWQNNKKHNLNEIFITAKSLYKDDFLYALVEQIVIDESNRMTLIPKVGPRLVIGDSKDLGEKLINLKEGYKQILKRDGWEGIEELNFEIKNQILKVKPELDKRVSSVILSNEENHKL